eukprot:763792-Hanusia_phi.AAC.6
MVKDASQKLREAKGSRQLAREPAAVARQQPKVDSPRKVRATYKVQHEDSSARIVSWREERRDCAGRETGGASDRGRRRWVVYLGVETMTRGAGEDA